MKIALDAMGCDFGVKIPVEAALIAAKELNYQIILVGDQFQIKSELDKLSKGSKNIEIVHAEEKIEMKDNIIDAVKKRKSSMRIAYNLHKKGEVAGIVSAGHSGAMLGLGKAILKTYNGIERPCISALMPSRSGRVLLADAGANLDCSPDQLLNFARLATIYLQHYFNIKNPKVGLLNIGHEESKGDDNLKATHKLFQNTDKINFYGNIEGKYTFDGVVDIIICDGLLGNILLKSIEGTASFIRHLAKEQFKQSTLLKIALPLMFFSFKALKKKIDYAEYGGAPLLGLKGVSIVCHGSSNAEALVFGLKCVAIAEKKQLVNQYIQILNGE